MFHKKSVWLRRYLVCVFRQRQGAQHFLHDMAAVSKFIWWQLLYHIRTPKVLTLSCWPMYRYVSHPSGSVSYLEHIGKIRSPKGSGRNFSQNRRNATESTIKSLVSVAIYFLKYLRTLIGYRFRDSEIYSFYEYISPKFVTVHSYLVPVTNPAHFKCIFDA